MLLPNSCLMVLSFGLVVSAALPKSSTIPSNISTPLLDTSVENTLSIVCNGSAYGYNPNILDCERAKEFMPPDPSIWIVGERDTGLPLGTVPLPYRVMGNRGLCYVQPVLIGDHKTAQASLNMMRRAAAALVMQCAIGFQSQGGIATNIGKNESQSHCKSVCCRMAQ